MDSIQLGGFQLCGSNSISLSFGCVAIRTSTSLSQSKTFTSCNLQFCTSENINAAALRFTDPKNKAFFLFSVIGLMHLSEPLSKLLDKLFYFLPVIVFHFQGYIANIVTINRSRQERKGKIGYFFYTCLINSRHQGILKTVSFAKLN